MTIILKHTDNNSTEQLDKLFTTIDLKKVLSNYKRDTNLGAISKMNKKQLIKVLHDLQFKLHNIKDGDNLIYTFNLSQYDYDPDDPIKINKPLSKPKEIKPKPSKVVKPKLSITQQNISEYDKTMKFLDSNIEKLKNIPFGSIKRVNNPTKNYYDYFVNQIMVNGTGTGNQENYVKRAEYSIKYNKLILDDAKKILNKPSKKIDTPKTEESKPKQPKEIKPKQPKEIKPKPTPTPKPTPKPEPELTEMEKYMKKEEAYETKNALNRKLTYTNQKIILNNFTKENVNKIKTIQKLKDYRDEYENIKNEYIQYGYDKTISINKRNQKWDSHYVKLYEDDTEEGKKRFEKMIYIYNNHWKDIRKRAREIKQEPP